jgi:hypothetical protein
MAIASLATETKATALLTECRRCLAVGVDLRGQFIKDVIDQLESATVNDLSVARTDVTPNTRLDGRNTAEAAIQAA